MIVKIRIIPNSDYNEVISRIGSVLRVKVCSSVQTKSKNCASSNTLKAEDEVNVTLRNYLSEFFEVPCRMVNIIRGIKGREKTVEITGKTEEELKNMLDAIP